MVEPGFQQLHLTPKVQPVAKGVAKSNPRLSHPVTDNILLSPAGKSLPSTCPSPTWEQHFGVCFFGSPFVKGGKVLGKRV